MASCTAITIRITCVLFVLLCVERFGRLLVLARTSPTLKSKPSMDAAVPRKQWSLVVVDDGQVLDEVQKLRRHDLVDGSSSFRRQVLTGMSTYPVWGLSVTAK
jgi:hypothetical protein